MNFAIYCRLVIASLPIGEAVIKRESSGNEAANRVDNPETTRRQPLKNSAFFSYPLVPSFPCRVPVRLGTYSLPASVPCGVKKIPSRLPFSLNHRIFVDMTGSVPFLSIEFKKALCLHPVCTKPRKLQAH